MKIRCNFKVFFKIFSLNNAIFRYQNSFVIFSALNLVSLCWSFIVLHFYCLCKIRYFTARFANQYRMCKKLNSKPANIKEINNTSTDEHLVCFNIFGLNTYVLFIFPYILLRYLISSFYYLL